VVAEQATSEPDETAVTTPAVAKASAVAGNAEAEAEATGVADAFGKTVAETEEDAEEATCTPQAAEEAVAVAEPIAMYAEGVEDTVIPAGAEDAWGTPVVAEQATSEPDETAVTTPAVAKASAVAGNAEAEAEATGVADAFGKTVAETEEDTEEATCTLHAAELLTESESVASVVTPCLQATFVTKTTITADRSSAGKDHGNVLGKAAQAEKADAVGSEAVAANKSAAMASQTPEVTLSDQVWQRHWQAQSPRPQEELTEEEMAKLKVQENMRQKLLQRRLLLEPDSLAEAAAGRLPEEAVQAVKGGEDVGEWRLPAAEVNKMPAYSPQTPRHGMQSPAVQTRARAYSSQSLSTGSRGPGTPRQETPPLMPRRAPTLPESPHNTPVASATMMELQERLQQSQHRGFVDPAASRPRSRSDISEYDPDRIHCVIPAVAPQAVLEDTELDLALQRRRQEVEESAATFTKEGSSSSADVAWSH